MALGLSSITTLSAIILGINEVAIRRVQGI